MWTLLTLYMACAWQGIPGETCIVVSYVESRHTPGAVSSVGCLGLCQVAPAYSPVPAWALRTTVGGAVGGALAVRYWRDAKGVKWPRHYACGNRADGSRCMEYETKVKRLLARWRRGGDWT